MMQRDYQIDKKEKTERNKSKTFNKSWYRKEQAKVVWIFIIYNLKTMVGFSEKDYRSILCSAYIQLFEVYEYDLLLLRGLRSSPLDYTMTM